MEGHFREDFAYVRQKFIGTREAEFEFRSFRRQLRRHLERGGRDNDGSAGRAELFGEVAQPPTDAVGFAIASEIFEEENRIAADQTDVSQRRLRLVRAIDSRSAGLCETRRDGPGVGGNGELGRRRDDELFQAVLFTGLNRDDGAGGIDQENQLVAFARIGIWGLERRGG